MEHIKPLRKYREHHHDENLESLSGFHENELFSRCIFRNVRNVTLKDCNLRESEFLTDDVKDALGFTVTVGDCHTFRDVKFSPLLFDLMLVMLTMTSGNTEKRRKIIDLLGHDRVYELLKKLETLETKE